MKNGAASTLLDTTLALLKRAEQKGVTDLEIYKATELRPNWISKLRNGRVSDPSVNRVQALHDYLRGVCSA